MENLGILHGMPSEEALCLSQKDAEMEKTNVKSITQLLAWHGDHKTAPSRPEPLPHFIFAPQSCARAAFVYISLQKSTLVILRLLR